MNIVHIVKKTYPNGLTDYFDLEGNKMDYEPSYTPTEQWYIDTTPEEWAKDRERSRIRSQQFLKERMHAQRMFVVNEFDDHPLPPPKLGGGSACWELQPCLTADKGESHNLRRLPLWGDYWAERELCVLAGDVGVGKSLLALQVARHLAGGRVLGVEDDIGKPRRVLYIDFELDKEGFYERFGVGYPLEYLHWAGYNQTGARPGHLGDAGAWLLDTLHKMLVETKSEVVIIDQPDRLHIGPQQWRELLLKLRALMNEHGIAMMLVVNTKARNYARPMEMSHIFKYKELGFTADSIIGLGADYANMYGRYIKVFKNRNRGVHYAAPLEGFMLAEPEEEPIIKTQIFTTAPRPEEEYLQPNKGKIREQKMMAAEAMRLDGCSYARIANELEVPEVSVRRWVSGIKPKELYRGDEVSPAFRGEEEERPVEEPVNSVPDIESNSELDSPDRESCIDSVENPSPNPEASGLGTPFLKGDLLIDEFAFNAELIEREKREKRE